MQLCSFETVKDRFFLAPNRLYYWNFTREVISVTKLIEGVTLLDAKDNKELDNRQLKRMYMTDTYMNLINLSERTNFFFSLKMSGAWSRESIV